MAGSGPDFNYSAHTGVTVMSLVGKRTLTRQSAYLVKAHILCGGNTGMLPASSHTHRFLPSKPPVMSSLGQVSAPESLMLCWDPQAIHVYATAPEPPGRQIVFSVSTERNFEPALPTLPPACHCPLAHQPDHWTECPL